MGGPGAGAVHTDVGGAAGAKSLRGGGTLSMDLQPTGESLGRNSGENLVELTVTFSIVSSY